MVRLKNSRNVFSPIPLEPPTVVLHVSSRYKPDTSDTVRPTENADKIFQTVGAVIGFSNRLDVNRSICGTE